MPTDCTFMMSYDVDHQVLNDLESELDVLRRCIAVLSAEMCGSMSDLMTPLAPSALAVIDLEESSSLISV